MCIDIRGCVIERDIVYIKVRLFGVVEGECVVWVRGFLVFF